MLNKTDKKILAILQENCQISNLELAEKVALSPSPCLRRVRQLEEKGFIKKQVALLNPKALGLQLSILILVGVDSHAQAIMQGFEKTISAIPEVLECHLITGQTADYLLKVVVPDIHYYQKFLLEQLTCIEGVSSVQSSFVLKSIADKTELPLDYT